MFFLFAYKESFTIWKDLLGKINIPYIYIEIGKDITEDKMTKKMKKISSSYDSDNISSKICVVSFKVMENCTEDIKYLKDFFISNDEDQDTINKIKYQSWFKRLNYILI